MFRLSARISEESLLSPCSQRSNNEQRDPLTAPVTGGGAARPLRAALPPAATSWALRCAPLASRHAQRITRSVVTTVSIATAADDPRPRVKPRRHLEPVLHVVRDNSPPQRVSGVQSVVGGRTAVTLIIRSQRDLG
jgi:hypothetical protein